MALPRERFFRPIKMHESRTIRSDDPKKVTREDMTDVCAKVLAYRDRTGMHSAFIAREIGVSPSVVSVEQVGTSPQAVIKAIGRTMRVSPGVRSQGISSRMWFDAIKQTLKGTSRLLIIDQIHKLTNVDAKDRALYALCDLHDATGAPQLWVGTTDLVEYLERNEGRGKEPLAQIRSRIAICRDLQEKANDPNRGEPLFTIDDIRKVYGKNKLKLTRDGERYLMKLANLRGSGGLLTCTNIVRVATKVNGEWGGSLSGDMLHAMRGLLANQRVMQRTEAHRLKIPINGGGCAERLSYCK